MTWSVSAKIRDYAQLTRVSNLPTVVSNVLVGSAIGARVDVMPWRGVAVVGMATVLLYMGGMALNDAVDAAVDRRQRPERPIPSGRVSLRQAYGVAVVLFLIALGLLATLGMGVLGVGLVLLGLIVGYDALHKQWAGSVIVMGLCRGWVYVLAACAVSISVDVDLTGGMTQRLFGDDERQVVIQQIPVLVGLGGMLTIYTVALSVIARMENDPWEGATRHSGRGKGGGDPRRWLAVGVPVLVLAATFGFKPRQAIGSVVVGLIMAAWLGRAAGHLFFTPPRVKPFVMAGVSGISLVDAYFLCLLDHSALSIGAIGCFIVAVWSQRYVSGA